ncbi:protein NRT1/ PTR FAMILY 5.10-like [Primulina eburnea]|uniref:protein NRT1/ PTR FAMILY 5.10-like n=1 Tax=Primulina eburnea TaxID=1245227 RepID=UPI003C6C8E80
MLSTSASSVVALAQGGHKPCVQAFGPEQFDEQDPIFECKAKSSFFNWWYFSFCAGVFVALVILNYIQDILGWVLGFGIPCIVICLALTIFFMGTRTYRFRTHSDDRNPFIRIGQVFVRTVRYWQTNPTPYPEWRKLREFYLLRAFSNSNPMSVWWLIPQYLLFGVADVITMVGFQEFFYDQSTGELKSLGLSLYLCIFCIGSC